MAERKIKFGKHEFNTTTFGARKQLTLLPDVLRFADGPLKPVLEIMRAAGAGGLGEVAKARAADPKAKVSLGSMDVGAILREVNPDVLSAGLMGLADFIDEQGFDFIESLLVDTFKVVDKKGRLASCVDDFDTMFESDMYLLLRVILWVLGENYAPFLRSKIGPLAGLMKKSSESLTA